jgi:hypothetical protein
MFFPILKTMTQFDYSQMQGFVGFPISQYIPTSGVRSGRLVVAIQGTALHSGNSMSIVVCPAWKIDQENVAMDSTVSIASLTISSARNSSLQLLSIALSDIPGPGVMIQLAITNALVSTDCKTNMMLGLELLPT